MSTILLGLRRPWPNEGRCRPEDAPERAAPFHHCRVEVRMRDSDSLQATEPVDQGSGRRVQHRNAVPQDISIGCANNQRTLADRKLRLCANADYSRLVLAV